ncbi:MAG TPA: metal-dependent hydrolase [bacterium]|nr:metal-dependent hydrolase [bacterium]
MASALTHAFVGSVMGKIIRGKDRMPRRFWIGLALTAALPDLDVVSFHLGIPYESPWGHRGFTHSLVFAAFLGWLTLELLRLGEKRFSRNWWMLWACFFLATASHGLLDAMTNGGMGIAFFWPFRNARYFLPWRPILVSPVAFQAFFHHRAFAILKSEFLWVWIPVVLLWVLSAILRRVLGSERPK